MTPIKKPRETGRLLWTTMPEKIPVRRPTVVVCALAEHEARAVYALHSPVLSGVPLFSMGPECPSGGTIFQLPGEGPWRCYPPCPAITRMSEDGDSRTRMRNVTAAAAQLGRWLVERQPGAVVWEMGGAWSGNVAVGLALGAGRCVCLSHEVADRLTIALADEVGVQIKSVRDKMDQAKAIHFLGGF